MNVVTVPLRARMVTGFVTAEVDKPEFNVKPIKTLLSSKPLPAHCLKLAQWLSVYYHCNLSEALRQFAPSKPTLRHTKQEVPDLSHDPDSQIEIEAPLTKTQEKALDEIRKNPSVTVLLHGITGSGKTRIYLELAKETLEKGRSVIMLTPEIALTTQLIGQAKKSLGTNVFILHSQLSQAKRKQIWLSILESTKPVVIIGPRSALFSPVHNPGLVILDEAHEPAYKQDQSPRYHAARVASQLGLLTASKVILGTATPLVTDYYLAEDKNAVVNMNEQAITSKEQTTFEVVDLKDRSNFTTNPYLSTQFIDAAKEALGSKKQVMIYLNRRGSARLVLCNKCGWQLLCPHCDIPLVYHADEHLTRCHVCGYNQTPPNVCLKCKNPDIIYKSIGTKALAAAAEKLFPQYKVQRFDSDSLEGEHVNDLFHQLQSGEIDILVGTQLLAKGLDLPRLGLVGIVSAESSMGLPDYTSEERAFQLLYQVIGRVGRGHIKGKIILQSYDPKSIVVESALNRDWHSFYKYTLQERQDFRFPPFSYMLQLSCKRATLKGVEQASSRLKKDLLGLKLPVEIIGPTPSFYARRGKFYYYQIIAKAKNRSHLLELAKHVPADWTVNLDPANLL